MLTACPDRNIWMNGSRKESCEWMACFKSDDQIRISNIKSPSDRGASRESDESQPDRNLSICGTREGKTHVSFSERSELLLQSERRQNCWDNISIRKVSLQACLFIVSIIVDEGISARCPLLLRSFRCPICAARWSRTDVDVNLRLVASASGARPSAGGH